MTTKPFSVWHLFGINYSSNNKFLLESNQNIKCLSATTGVTTISKIFIRQVGQKFQNLDLTQDPTMKGAQKVPLQKVMQMAFSHSWRHEDMGKKMK